MPLFEKYKKYFNIDPEYFPAVNEKLINDNPNLWKTFYPHKTFVKLLKDTLNALDRRKKLSIWVEGAYGTGKSHAVLTIKKLLEADDADTAEYFEKFDLDRDILNNLQRVKNSGKILTVHRYGSSRIHGDEDLVLAIQESIEKALSDAGIENQASASLKSSVIKYLSNDENKRSFNIYADGSYSDLFGGDMADDIIRKLNEYTGSALQTLMAKLFKFGKGHPIFSTNTTDLAGWIREVISANNLKAVVFIWDEFTEFFTTTVGA